MARYRLRFVLQEFDLPRGVTLIGRSLDCHLTIEDPLVSRRHARIMINDAGAQVEDLGSRNGVKVNGATIRQATSLRNGDRLRIGTQELVFSRVDDVGRPQSRTTGQLRLCANCRQPYPREVVSCPNCEATEQTDDDTLTASGSELSQQWTLQLFVEALERASRLGRTIDAERLVRRATMQVEEALASGGHVDEVALSNLAVQACTVTLATNDPTWAMWAVDFYGRSGRFPDAKLAERVVEVFASHAGVVRDAIRKLSERLRPSMGQASAAQIEALARMTGLDVEAAVDATSDWR